MRARIICLLLLLSDTASSTARTPLPAPVYRCGQAASLRYQDVPCGEGEPSTHWRPPPGRASAASRADAVRGARPPAAPARRATRHVQRRGPAAALITLQQDPEDCRRMKQLREASLRRRQRPVGYLVEREWEDPVRDACR